MAEKVFAQPYDLDLLTRQGFEILIESNAGEKSYFLDSVYSEAGAQIEYDSKKIYQADLILKIEPPSLEENEMMKKKHKYKEKDP